MSDKVYGIDLGTTYSAIARINSNGLPEIIENSEGDRTTPSAIYFEDSGNAVVGKEAKNAAVADPDNACLLIKRHMGEVHPVEYFGQTYTPESLSAMILKEMVDSANQLLQEDTKKVVITVPAYFGVKEREATRQAGEMAGLEVVGIVTEPVAAALSIGAAQEGKQTLMIYDLGGGTFDTTIMSVDEGKVTVHAIDGNRLLGGADWDKELIALIVQKFIAASGTSEDPYLDEDFMADVEQQAEELKKSLTKKESKSLLLNMNGERGKVEVTRAEFEKATQALVAETVDIAKRTVETAQEKVPGLKVDKVVLVGGSSRMPMIRRALEERLGWQPLDSEFDLAVAKGAAIYGQAAVDEVLSLDETAAEAPAGDTGERRNYLPGASSTLTVTNVLSRGLGVKFVDENEEPYVSFFAHTNDNIPFTPDPIEAYTVAEGQSEVALTLYQQAGEVESEKIEDNKLLKEGILDLGARMPKGTLINIYCDISGEGTVKLRAVEPGSSREINIEATVSVLSAEEVAEETVKVQAISLRS